MKKIFLFCCILLPVISCVSTETNYLEYIDKSIIENDNDGKEKYGIHYPVFEGYEKLNAEIEKLVNNSKQEIDKIKDLEKKARRDAEKQGTLDKKMYYTFYSNLYYDEPVICDNYISIVFYFYSCTGGAHGNTVAQSINYDVKNDRLVQLSDILELYNENWLNILSEYTIKNLIERNNNKKMQSFSDDNGIKEGASAKEENFSVFSVMGDGVKIIFQQYQVAAYVAGFVEINVPFSIFEKIIVP